MSLAVADCYRGDGGGEGRLLGSGKEFTLIDMHMLMRDSSGPLMRSTY